MKKVFMKKPFPKMILRILLVCVLLLGFLFIWMTILAHLLPIWNQIFAIYRRFQRIGSLRRCFRYDGDLYLLSPRSERSYFSVYVNRPDFPSDISFAAAEVFPGVERGIAEFTVDGHNERAFISMNQPKAARLEIDDGNTVQIIDLNSDQPFAIVLPANVGVIHFYDGNGNPVNYQKEPSLTSTSFQTINMPKMWT